MGRTTFNGQPKKKSKTTFNGRTEYLIKNLKGKECAFERESRTLTPNLSYSPSLALPRRPPSAVTPTAPPFPALHSPFFFLLSTPTLPLPRKNPPSKNQNNEKLSRQTQTAAGISFLPQCRRPQPSATSPIFLNFPKILRARSSWRNSELLRSSKVSESSDKVPCPLSWSWQKSHVSIWL